MSKIIALVDGSAYSQSVCDHAAWVARAKGVAVEILHVMGRREGGTAQNLSGSIGLGARSALLEELAELDAQTAKLALKRGRAILDDAEARVRADGVADVTTRLRHGDLMEELADSEKDADLVVIGKRGEAADFAKLHLGSNLERVVRSCTRPVLVASREFRPVETFMIAFDGGASSLKAVNHIAYSRVFAGKACELISVGPESTDNTRAIQGAAALLKGAGYRVKHEIVAGQPEAVISEKVETGSIDLLVMGAYGHSRIRSLIIGSTTTAMVRAVHIPLLLFR